MDEPIPTEDELSALVERARTGDPAAWIQLYETYEQDLRRRVRSRLGPQLRAQLDDSDDIMQSVWGEAIRSMKGFDRTKGEFVAWVNGIIRHKIAKRAEASHRKGAAIGGDEAGQIIANHPASQTGVSVQLHNAEERLLLQKALGELRPEDREVIQLSWIDELKHREIGDRLGIKEDAARMRVTRAEAALGNIFRRLESGGRP